ncbi:MAG: SDR family oxidoreductase, partial [Verrucomicrobia bacterium]|nr:SDR family oxidoreductase [Verrucomicrobiota bacterium]
IGKALAKNLLEQGHTVAGFSRSGKTDELQDVSIHTCDATDPDALESTLKALHDELGGIDGYTHAIGSIFLRPAHLTSPEDWQKTIRANLDSAFYALRVVSKIMTKQGSGSCLFFSTAAAQTGIANHEVIAAAKGGLEAMVRSAAASYSNRGVRFNAIAPSLTDTPLSKDILGSEQALEISKKMHPLGDITHAADVASLAAWLHSDAAKFATGQTFVLDGGISTVVPKPKA